MITIFGKMLVPVTFKAEHLYQIYRIETAILVTSSYNLGIGNLITLGKYDSSKLEREKELLLLD